MDQVRGPVDDPKIAAWMLDAEKNKERSLVDLLHDYAKQKSAFFYDAKAGRTPSFDFACVKAHHSLLLSRVLREKFTASKQEIKVYQKVYFFPSFTHSLIRSFIHSCTHPRIAL
jgi:hypothetical protein